MYKYVPVCVAIGMVVLSAGCRHFVAAGNTPVGQTPVDALQNPLPVPLVPRELVMDEISDEIDNYFRILREQHIRQVGDVLTEGWIETEPKIGATILEPWRNDSTAGFERTHSSLQTVRRWAKVRVIPNGNRYLVDVKVHKELEDLMEPEKATTSAQVYRHDNSLDVDRTSRLLVPPNKGWIPLGRDFSLEQQILGNIQSRLNQAVQVDPHTFDR